MGILQPRALAARLEQQQVGIRVIRVNPNPNPKCRVLIIFNKFRVVFFKTRNFKNPNNPTRNFRVTRMPSHIQAPSPPLASIAKKMNHPSVAEAVLDGRKADADRTVEEALELDILNRSDM